MLEIILILLIIIPSILISYKVGRKKKKIEMDTMGYLILFSLIVTTLLYSILRVDFGNLLSESPSPPKHGVDILAYDM